MMRILCNKSYIKPETILCPQLLSHYLKVTHPTLNRKMSFSGRDQVLKGLCGGQVRAAQAWRMFGLNLKIVVAY